MGNSNEDYLTVCKVVDNLQWRDEYIGLDLKVRQKTLSKNSGLTYTQIDELVNQHSFQKKYIIGKAEGECKYVFDNKRIADYCKERTAYELTDFKNDVSKLIMAICNFYSMEFFNRGFLSGASIGELKSLAVKYNRSRTDIVHQVISDRIEMRKCAYGRFQGANPQVAHAEN